MTENYPTIPYRRERLSADVSIRRARDFLSTIRERRTVRDFSPDPIPDEVLAHAIAAAATATALYGLTDDGRHVTHDYVNESVGIACGFLLAALNAAGLATVTHTPSPMGFLREILGRPKNEKPYVLIPVGYPSDSCRVPDIRKKALHDVMIVR